LPPAKDLISVLQSLLDVFEEDPVVEAAALGALAGRH
jgi:hypothetical protein